MNTDTAEPAFPGAGSLPGSNHRIFGMTLRDYFAAKAMQALITEAFTGDTSARVEQALARTPASAYEMADLMLKARQS